MNPENNNFQKKISPPKKIYEGIVDVTKSGNAFIIVKDLANDIMVQKQDLGPAFHKDFVSVKIIRRGDKRLYGHVIKVLKRKNTEMVGTIEQIGKGYYFLPMSKYKIGAALFIKNLDVVAGIKPLQKVLAKIANPETNKLPFMEILSAWNQENDDKFTLNEILVENGFHLDFPDEVIDFCNQLKIDITKELLSRNDYRNIFTITIDPADAKDFDDALSIQFLPNGNIEVGVHIADVSHFVAADTPIDVEAKERATSVYMPGFVLPMLPHNISDDLCSLVPKQDRLTFATIVELKVSDNKVEIIACNFSKTIIHSNHRFAYEDVQQIIETQTGEHKKEVLQLYAISKILRNERMQQGAINFSSTELRFKLDENNFPISIMIKESKESHQLVEEFMLLANKKVAEFISKQKPSPAIPYRIHDEPDEKKVAFFIDLVRKSGYMFDSSNKKNFASSVNKLLADAKQSERFYVFEKLAIRSMAKAVYSTNNIGHYGLGFVHYAHFTSPIRRYPDILTHRALQAVLTNATHYKSKSSIEKDAIHCSTKEKSAVDAERLSIKYKQTQYMSQFIGQDFDAIITGVASFGFWAETIEHKCEGVIKMTDILLIDDFVFKADEMCLVGKNSKLILDLGKKIKIKVLAANIEDKETTYMLLPNNT